MYHKISFSQSSILSHCILLGPSITHAHSIRFIITWFCLYTWDNWLCLFIIVFLSFLFFGSFIYHLHYCLFVKWCQYTRTKATHVIYIHFNQTSFKRHLIRISQLPSIRISPQIFFVCEFSLLNRFGFVHFVNYFVFKAIYRILIVCLFGVNWLEYSPIWTNNNNASLAFFASRILI